MVIEFGSLYRRRLRNVQPAEAGYVVDSVTVDGDDVTATVTDNTLVLTMDDDHTVVVKFFQKWGLDGVAHWLMGTGNGPENHVDQDGDGVCDICCYNIPSDGENDEPGTDNPEGGNPNPNAPGGGEVDDSNPKTGDNRATVLWIALLAASGLAGVLTLRRRSAKF